MQKAAAPIAIRLVAIARSSRRSAPATRFLCAPHCAINRPAAVARVPSPTTETTIRWRSRLPPSRPASRVSTRPPVSAMIGEIPA